MSKKPNVVVSYGDPRKSRRWPAKRIRREFTREILDGIMAEQEEGKKRQEKAANLTGPVEPVLSPSSQ